MTTTKPRVRFAPSPTGNLHIGGMRTALFNWLFARHNGGLFFIRIEDTDLERSKKEYVDAQIAALSWCGIESDLELIFQSERTAVYEEQLQKLFTEQKIYRCICSPEEIEKRVRESGNKDEYFGYDEFCRDKNIGADSKDPFVIRFALPKDLTTLSFDDAIRGKVTFDKSQLDDFIIVRSDGSPTYNFVVVVDDHFMQITNIIRGEDHLSNTPKQMLLYQACGFNIPQFAHIPLILNASGQRLSKRDGAVDVLHYKKFGYLPQALVNYCVRLGWAHGDDEIFTQEQLIEYFTLKAVGKKSAVFDIQKLQWLNSVYIKKLSPETCLNWLVADVEPELFEKLSGWQKETIIALIGLYQERVKTGIELVNILVELHHGPSEYSADDLHKWVGREPRGQLDKLVPELEALPEFTAEKINQTIKTFCKEHDIKLVTVAQPLRIALTGTASSPGVFDLLAQLGKAESIKRVHALQTFLESR
jgi:glutamyl-tRNA synthetase